MTAYALDIPPAASSGKLIQTSEASINDSQDKDVAFGAAVPALGLSNKAIYSSEAAIEGDGPDLAPTAQPASMTERPLEEHLQQSSLWPEIYKVYGHGNEVYSLAADPRQEYLASTCKAQV